METEGKQITSNGLLDQIIDKLAKERILNISYKRSGESTCHDKREKKLISLSNDIRDKLDLDQNLFMRYEELSTINENALLRDIYRKGFSDGVALLRELMF